MKIIKILLTIFLVVGIANASYASVVRDEIKRKYMPVIGEVINKIVKEHIRRIKTTSIVIACKDMDLFNQLNEQGTITKDLDKYIKEAGAKYSFTDEDYDVVALAITMFIGGHREGYAQGVFAFVKEEDGRNKVCNVAKKNALKELTE